MLHIGKYYPPDPGGMEFFLQYLAERQAEDGHRVLVLAHAAKAPPGAVQVGPNLTVKRFGVWFKVGGYAPVAPALLRAVRRACSEFRPDLIHLHCPNPAGVALWPLPCPVPLVLHWHSDVIFPPEHSPATPLLSLWRVLERGLLGRAAAVIATSPPYAASSQPLRRFSDKVRVIPSALPRQVPAGFESTSGPAISWFREKPTGSRILAVGRLSHYKGFSVLLNAVARLPHLNLCLIGQGEEEKDLKSLSRDLGLTQRVFFAGQVSNAEREACLAMTDLFCLPSLNRTEAFGLVLLEAMRASRPCLTANVPGSGMSYVVDKGQAGALVEPGNIEQLTGAISRLINNPQLREALATRGHNRFLQNFTIASVAGRIEEVYRDMLV